MDDGSAAEGADEDVDWQGSHYRRMERERLVLLEKRRRDREARKLASANAKALDQLRAQYQEHAHQQQLAQQHYQTGHRQQASNSSIESYYAGGDASSSSLSRSTTSSSTTSSTSSNRFISTHPSRSRTPDLLPSGGGIGQHGRNESLASTVSTRSSASTSGWGWNPRLGWGAEAAQAGGASTGDVIAEVDEEEEEEAVERIRVPLRSSRNGKGKQREEWGAGGDGKGMRMSDVLNEILEMEKGFVVGGLGSPTRATPAPTSRDTWMGTPPRMAAASSRRDSSTPTGRKLGLGHPSEALPRTPSRVRSASNNSSIPFPTSVASKGTKRSHATTPPSPPSNSHYHPHPHARASSSRRTGSFGTSHHRRSVSSPSSLSLNKKHHRPAKSLPFDDDDTLPPSSRRQRRSGSPVPPPSSVIPSRPRTLVYSPRSDVGGGFGGSQRSLSVSSIAEDFDGRPDSPPLLPPPSRHHRGGAFLPSSPSNSFKGLGKQGGNFAFPPVIGSHPTSASLVVMLDTSPPLLSSSIDSHNHFPRSDSYASSLARNSSIYEPNSPVLTPTGSFFHDHLPSTNTTHFLPPSHAASTSLSSLASLEGPPSLSSLDRPQSVLAPPLFPCSPTPGTPEMVRMPERSRARLRALMLSEGGEMDWRMGGDQDEEVEQAWGEIEIQGGGQGGQMEVDSPAQPPAEVKKGKLGWATEGWMPTFLEAEGFEEGR